MIIKKFAEAIRQQDWFTVALEILVVVIGIFVGLQVDDWNDSRKAEARASEYVTRISRELQLDLTAIDRCLEIARARKNMGRLLLEALADPQVVLEDAKLFMYALQRAGWTWMPTIHDNTFQEIKMNGELSVINEELRSAIASYYSLVEARQQWNYLRENVQNAFEVERLGVLTADQEYRLWDSDYESLTVTVEEAMEALERLRSQDDFILHLPRTTSQRNSIVTCDAWQNEASKLQVRRRMFPG